MAYRVVVNRFGTPLLSNAQYWPADPSRVAAFVQANVDNANHLRFGSNDLNAPRLNRRKAPGECLLYRCDYQSLLEQVAFQKIFPSVQLQGFQVFDSDLKGNYFSEQLPRCALQYTHSVVTATGLARWIFAVPQNARRYALILTTPSTSNGSAFAFENGGTSPNNTVFAVEAGSTLVMSHRMLGDVVRQELWTFIGLGGHIIGVTEIEPV